MKRLFIIWAPVLVWMAVIFLFSSSSDPFWALPSSWKEPIVQARSDQETRQKDSLVEILGQNGHVLEYTILGFLAYRSIAITTGPRPVTLLVTLAVVLCFFYGLSDEIHQAFIPFRAFQLSDLILDSIGGLSGSLVASLVYKNNRLGGEIV
jgi:VanZ family protein